MFWYYRPYELDSMSTQGISFQEVLYVCVCAKQKPVYKGIHNQMCVYMC